MSLNDRPISTWFTRFAYGPHWAAYHSETRAPTLDFDDTITNEGKVGGDARSATSSVTVRLAGDRDIGADGSDRRRRQWRATTARNSLSTRADSDDDRRSTDGFFIWLLQLFRDPQHGRPLHSIIPADSGPPLAFYAAACPR